MPVLVIAIASVRAVSVRLLKGTIAIAEDNHNPTQGSITRRIGCQVELAVAIEVANQGTKRRKRILPCRSLVCIRLAALARVRHEGFAGNAKIALDHESGWKRVLVWMRRFLEGSETVDTRQSVE